MSLPKLVCLFEWLSQDYPEEPYPFDTLEYSAAILEDARSSSHIDEQLFVRYQRLINLNAIDSSSEKPWFEAIERYAKFRAFINFYEQHESNDYLVISLDFMLNKGNLYFSDYMKIKSLVEEINEKRGKNPVLKLSPAIKELLDNLDATKEQLKKIRIALKDIPAFFIADLFKESVGDPVTFSALLLWLAEQSSYSLSLYRDVIDTGLFHHLFLVYSFALGDGLNPLSEVYTVIAYFNSELVYAASLYSARSSEDVYQNKNHTNLSLLGSSAEQRLLIAQTQKIPAVFSILCKEQVSALFHYFGDASIAHLLQSFCDSQFVKMENPALYAAGFNFMQQLFNEFSEENPLKFNMFCSFLQNNRLSYPSLWVLSRILTDTTIDLLIEANCLEFLSIASLKRLRQKRIPEQLWAQILDAILADTSRAPVNILYLLMNLYCCLMQTRQLDHLKAKIHSSMLDFILSNQELHDRNDIIDFIQFHSIYTGAVESKAEVLYTKLSQQVDTLLNTASPLETVFGKLMDCWNFLYSSYSVLKTIQNSIQSTFPDSKYAFYAFLIIRMREKYPLQFKLDRLLRFFKEQQTLADQERVQEQILAEVVAASTDISLIEEAIDSFKKPKPDEPSWYSRLYDGKSILRIAVKRNNVFFIKLLFDNLRTKRWAYQLDYEKNCILLAAELGLLEIIDCFLSLSDEYKDWIPICINAAMLNNHWLLVEHLIEKLPRDNRFEQTISHILNHAAYRGIFAAVDMLQSKHKLQCHLKNAIYFAADQGQWDMIRHLRTKDQDALDETLNEELLEACYICDWDTVHDLLHKPQSFFSLGLVLKAAVLDRNALTIQLILDKTPALPNELISNNIRLMAICGSWNLLPFFLNRMGDNQLQIEDISFLLFHAFIQLNWKALEWICWTPSKPQPTQAMLDKLLIDCCTLKTREAWAFSLKLCFKEKGNKPSREAFLEAIDITNQAGAEHIVGKLNTIYRQQYPAVKPRSALLELSLLNQSPTERLPPDSRAPEGPSLQ